MEYHLISERGYSDSQASIRVEKACFKQEIGLRVNLKENYKQEICGIAKVRHVIMPPLFLIVDPFGKYQHCQQCAVVVIVKTIGIAAKEKCLENYHHHSADESDFVTESGTWS